MTNGQRFSSNDNLRSHWQTKFLGRGRLGQRILGSTVGLWLAMGVGMAIAQTPSPESLEEAVRSEEVRESEGLQRGNGQSSEAAEKIGTFTPGPCPFLVPPTLAADRLQCGVVIVPERHGEPESGRSLRLGVAILKGLVDDGTDTLLQPDPLVMVQGGPGGSMVELMPYFGPELSAAPGIGADRDLVLLDQRGTLHSEPFLFCDEVYQFRVKHARDPESPELRERLHEATAACRDRLTEGGVDLAAFNSVESAADVAMVVQALGYEEFDLYGVS